MSTIEFPAELSAKGKIIRAAEQLFAEKGMEATSLREIAQLAQQKNTNAVQYHFGGKAGLIKAIWQRHASDIQTRRQTLLDEVDLEDSPSLKILVTAVILPVAEKLSDADGGRHYIQIMSHLISYAESSLLELFEATPDPTTTDLLVAMGPHINHLSDSDKRARMLFVAGVLFHSLADYIRLSGKASPLTDQLKESDVIGNLISMLTAAISCE